MHVDADKQDFEENLALTMRRFEVMNDDLRLQHEEAQVKGYVSLSFQSSKQNLKLMLHEFRRCTHIQRRAFNSFTVKNLRSGGTILQAEFVCLR